MLLTQFLCLVNAKNHLPDVNNDSQNTYTYTAYAFLHFRYLLDWQAGGLNGLNLPILQLPNYLLGMLPTAATYLFIMAILFATQVAIFRIVCLIVDLERSQLVSKKRRKVQADNRKELMRHYEFVSLISSFALATPLFISELGTTMGDWITISIEVIALYFLIQGVSQEKQRLVYLSGFYFTVAAALKLINFVYLLSAILTLAIVNFHLIRKSMRYLFHLLLGVMSAAILASPWYLFVFKLTGNPVFPYFNGIFQSRYYLDGCNKYIY